MRCCPSKNWCNGVDQQLVLLFPNILMLLCYHMAITLRDLSNLFTVPSTYQVCISSWSPQLCKQPTGNPGRRDVSLERYWCSEAPAHDWRWDQSQGHRAICTADARGSLLSKANTAFLVLCDAAGTTGEVRDRGEKGFLSPRCPPLKPKHKLVDTSPHKGALGGLTFIFELFCFLSLRVFSFPGCAVRPQALCQHWSSVPWPGNTCTPNFVVLGTVVPECLTWRLL